MDLGDVRDGHRRRNLVTVSSPAACAVCRPSAATVPLVGSKMDRLLPILKDPSGISITGP
jgi:hypothetical protein